MNIRFSDRMGERGAADLQLPTSLISYDRVKRTMDLLFVILAAPVAALLIAGFGLTIRLAMGPPVFFVQNRVGTNGRIFRIYKLRTMDCTSSQAIATAKNDSRITPLGRFLRLSHLDELPQLWNIFVGDMTLIGPRPEQPELVEVYRAALPDYDFRHSVVPGLTGWAQVNCGYAADVEETRTKLAYDLYYVRNVSPMLDIRIFLLTFVVYSNQNYVR